MTQLDTISRSVVSRSVVNRSAIGETVVSGLAIALLIALGIAAGRSVRLVRRDIEQLRHALTDSQQQRTTLKDILADHTRRLHTLAQLVEHTTDGVLLVDAQGVLLEVLHPSVLSNTNTEVGQPLEQVFPHDVAATARGLLEHTLSSHQPQQRHYTHHSNNPQDGQAQHYELHSVPIHDLPIHERQCLIIVHDISQQIAQQASAQQAQTILKNLPDAIGRFSRNGYYLEVINPGTFDQVLSHEQLEGKHLLDFLPYSVVKHIQQHFDKLYATGEPQSLYYHLNSKNGVPLYRHAYLMRSSYQEHIAIISDVTEQIRVERALEQSEARFREIAATVEAVFFVFDLVSQRFRYVSPQFDVLIGAPRQLLYDSTDIETTFAQLIYNADWETFRDAFDRLRNSHEIQIEYRLRHPSKGLRWLRTQASRGSAVEAAPHGYQGDLDSATTDQHMIGVITDITAYKHAQVALSDSEARLRAILQTLPDGIVQISYEGYYLALLHSGHYAPVLPQDQLIGKHIREVWPPAISQHIHHHLERISAGSSFETFTYDYEIADEIHYREVRIVPFDKHSCLSIISDVTERTHAAQALNHALAEKTTLLNEIHHRVKNNLQVIVSLLMLQARATHNPAVKKALDTNRQRITAMATVHKLMYASGSLTEVDFHSYLRAIVPQLLPADAVRTVQVDIVVVDVTLPLDSAIPLGIITAELLENVFQHAFTDLDTQPNHIPSNNESFDNPEGRHEDRHGDGQGSTNALSPADTPTVTLALEQHQDTVTLSVSDNGSGLPAAFDSDNLSRHTSLGIAIIDALVGQIGGNWHITRLAKGTQVKVFFDMEASDIEA